MSIMCFTARPLGGRDPDVPPGRVFFRFFSDAIGGHFGRDDYAPRGCCRHISPERKEEDEDEDEEEEEEEEYKSDD
jgi:hypothetical protein